MVVISLVCSGYIIMISVLSIENFNSKKPKDSRLTILSKNGIHQTRKIITLNAVCDCGNFLIVAAEDFKYGAVRSCGCLQKERQGKQWFGVEPLIPELKTRYRSMVNRCYNSKQKSYKRYGARGVRVCDDWLNSYKSFLEWSLSNGWKSGLCLDKDILGNGLFYSPTTCKWVSTTENVRNRSITLRVEYEGEMIPMAELCERFDISYQKFYHTYYDYGLDKAIEFYKNKLHLKFKRASTYFKEKAKKSKIVTI